MEKHQYVHTQITAIGILTFKLMCVSLTLISMGSTSDAESSSRKWATLRSVDIKKLAWYPWRRSCRKPLRSASGE